MSLHTTSAPPPAPLPTASTGLLTALRRAVAGAVLTPADDGYAALVAGQVPGYDRRPVVVVLARDAADVAAAVGVAATARLPVRVQATRHGTGGSHVGGLLVHTGRLDRVELDAAAGTLTVGAGTTAAAAVAAGAEAGFTEVTGSARGVGVVGSTLGGGLGPLGRAYGWASDHVVAAELVDPDGRRRRVDAEHDPELWWALRGGRYGFGVVTALTLRLLDVPLVRGRRAWFDATDAAVLLERFVDAEIPDAWTPTYRILRLPYLEPGPPPFRGRCVIELTGTWAGAGPENAGPDADELWAAWVDGVTPLAALAADGLAAWYATLADPEGSAPGWQAGRLLTGLTGDAVPTVVDLVGPHRELPLLAVELRRLGGRLRGTGALTTDGSVGGRDAAYLLNVVGAPDPSLFPHVLPTVFAGLEAGLEPWLHGGTQANFHGPLTPANPLSRAWPRDLAERLTALRRTVDPDGLFALPAEVA